MEFSEQYLTYKEYHELGGVIPETSFNLLEFEARRKIDIRTQDRLKGFASEEIPQEVKLCVYALINSIVIFSNTMTNAGNIASENTDGYSVSYITAGQIGEVVMSKNKELDDIIRTYLLGVVFNDEHLLYAGVK
jgi:hypothetical protein